jgi:hypothetical protein
MCVKKEGLVVFGGYIKLGRPHRKKREREKERKSC